MPLYDYSKLKGRIKEKYDLQSNFAKALGRRSGYVSKFLNHKSYLNQNEILRWCELLDIDHSEITSYFFTLKVDKMELENTA